MKKIILFVFFACSIQLVQAQLPNINVTNVRGRNIVNWINNLDGIQSIAIQRSNDSIKNYLTIGTLGKQKKGNGVFADEHPLIGKNFYRLMILFDGDIDWYSNKTSIALDSTTLAQLNSTSTTNNKFPLIINNGSDSIEIKPSEKEFTFTPSVHVYTNSFTGHININVEDAIGKRYSLIFYNSDKKEVLKVDRISINESVLDKHNFNGKGTFSFSLQEAGVEIEKGFVNVF